jgi:hypothetical protein
MVARANSGYVPTDDAFGRYTFQVLSSALKPGCAECQIVDGIDAMIGKLDRCVIGLAGLPAMGNLSLD